ncbi:MAG: hypothetical protein ACP5UN_01855 [Candidatus Micrarchaeia archaeon]
MSAILDVNIVMLKTHCVKTKFYELGSYKKIKLICISALLATLLFSNLKSSYILL